MNCFIWIIKKVKNKIRLIQRRKRSIKQLYIYPDTQNGWIKYPRPVIGGKNTGSYFDPYVCCEDGKFILYVSDRSNGSIVRMESVDGISWREVVTILNGRTKNDWDAVVNRGCVRKIGDQWFLWYTGQANGKSAIGVAISNDGTNYKRYEHNPILEPEFAYEGCAVMNPSVLYDNETGLFQMWYCSGEQCEPDVICFASSMDGFLWEKLSANPVFRPSNEVYDKEKVGGCDVFRYSTGKYGMFYIGYQNIDNACICYAQSNNGITDWTRSENNPIVSPTKGGWDAHAVYKPAFFYDEEKQKGYLWYNGRKNFKEYIGLATKDYNKAGDGV